MKVKVKPITVFLVLVLALLVISACSNSNQGENREISTHENEETETETNESENFNATGFPIVNEPITIQFMTGVPPTAPPDYNDVLVWKTYQDMTNIQVDWGMVQREGLEERRNLSLASGDYPEAFYAANIPAIDVTNYGEQGVFIALNDLIEEHMPNLKTLLDENPNLRRGMTSPDGNIYGLPNFSNPDFHDLQNGQILWIRQDWLDDLGMAVPQTTEDFYEYLTAVKNEDLIGNGEGEEIPYGGYSYLRLIFSLHGSFGVGNRGTAHSTIDMDPDTNELRFFPTSDRYRELLEYVHRLYSEGLIQQNIFSLDSNQYYAMGSQGLYGSTSNLSATNYWPEIGNQYVAVPALEGPHGDQQWAYKSSPASANGSFVITDKNENPEATARWVDYFYSEEGAKLFFMGIEGETFEVTEDGEIQYVEEIRNNPDGETLQEALRPYVTYAGGGYPAIIMREYFDGAETSEQSVAASETLKPDMIDEVWSRFTYTSEETQRLSVLAADIEQYVEETRAKLIVGEISFEQWDEYVEQLENMGLEEYMNIMQDAYERYQES